MSHITLDTFWKIYMATPSLRSVSKKIQRYNKLKSLGIRGKIGRWLFNFLSGRFLQVLVKGRKSSKSSLVSGVPQGSVIGPIIFLIYIYDISVGINATTLVYVDDTKLKKKIKSEEDVEILQQELDKLYSWGENTTVSFPCHCLNFASQLTGDF